MTAFEVMGETGVHPALRMGPLPPTAGWALFQAEIERSLLRLRGTHLRVSLFQVRLDVRNFAEVALAAALAPLGVVGRLPDGSLGLLYLGPRPGGLVGEAALVEAIEHRARAALGGPERHIAWSPGTRPLMAVVHAWSDELVGVGALLRLLLAWETPLHLVDLAAA